MKSYVNKHPDMGNMLWLEQGDILMGVALDYGIRVRHLSIKGMENLYYQQPADLSDGFGGPDEWKIRGGHRLWLTPETEASYYPDDEPISYTLKEDGVVILQNTEPPMGIQKELEITFRPDDTVHLIHRFYNRNDHPIDGASWAVNTLDGCGDIQIDFSPAAATDGPAYPNRGFAMWGETNPADPRLNIQKDRIYAKHLPIPEYFKIGVYSGKGEAVLESKGQRLTFGFEAFPITTLPDQGSNFELYLHKKFLEMETLGPVTHILPGEYATHWETWKLEKI